jgi:hypothetical protein
MRDRFEAIRIAVTWIPPLVALAWWIWRINSGSKLTRKWYANVWFVILAICLWAIVLDVIMLRLIHGH